MDKNHKTVCEMDKQAKKIPLRYQLTVSSCSSFDFKWRSQNEDDKVSLVFVSSFYQIIIIIIHNRFSDAFRHYNLNAHAI